MLRINGSLLRYRFIICILMCCCWHHTVQPGAVRPGKEQIERMRRSIGLDNALSKFVGKLEKAEDAALENPTSDETQTAIEEATETWQQNVVQAIKKLEEIGRRPTTEQQKDINNLEGRLKRVEAYVKRKQEEQEQPRRRAASAPAVLRSKNEDAAKRAAENEAQQALDALEEQIKTIEAEVEKLPPSPSPTDLNKISDLMPGNMLDRSQKALAALAKFPQINQDPYQTRLNNLVKRGEDIFNKLIALAKAAQKAPIKIRQRSRTLSEVLQKNPFTTYRRSLPARLTGEGVTFQKEPIPSPVPTPAQAAAVSAAPPRVSTLKELTTEEKKLLRKRKDKQKKSVMPKELEKEAYAVLLAPIQENIVKIKQLLSDYWANQQPLERYQQLKNLSNQLDTIQEKIKELSYLRRVIPRQFISLAQKPQPLRSEIENNYLEELKLINKDIESTNNTINEYRKAGPIQKTQLAPLISASFEQIAEKLARLPHEKRKQQIENLEILKKNFEEAQKQQPGVFEKIRAFFEDEEPVAPQISHSLTFEEVVQQQIASISQSTSVETMEEKARQFANDILLIEDDKKRANLLYNFVKNVLKLADTSIRGRVQSAFWEAEDDEGIRKLVKPYFFDKHPLPHKFSPQPLTSVEEEEEKDDPYLVEEKQSEPETPTPQPTQPQIVTESKVAEQKKPEKKLTPDEQRKQQQRHQQIMSYFDEITDLQDRYEQEPDSAHFQNITTLIKQIEDLNKLESDQKNSEFNKARLQEIAQWQENSMKTITPESPTIEETHTPQALTQSADFAGAMERLTTTQDPAEQQIAAQGLYLLLKALPEEEILKRLSPYPEQKIQDLLIKNLPQEAARIVRIWVLRLKSQKQVSSPATTSQQQPSLAQKPQPAPQQQAPALTRKKSKEELEKKKQLAKELMFADILPLKPDTSDPIEKFKKLSPQEQENDIINEIVDAIHSSTKREKLKAVLAGKTEEDKKFVAKLEHISRDKQSNLRRQVTLSIKIIEEALEGRDNLKNFEGDTRIQKALQQVVQEIMAKKIGESLRRQFVAKIATLVSLNKLNQYEHDNLSQTIRKLFKETEKWTQETEKWTQAQLDLAYAIAQDKKTDQFQQLDSKIRAAFETETYKLSKLISQGKKKEAVQKARIIIKEIFDQCFDLKADLLTLKASFNTYYDFTQDQDGSLKKEFNNIIEALSAIKKFADGAMSEKDVQSTITKVSDTPYQNKLNARFKAEQYKKLDVLAPDYEEKALRLLAEIKKLDPDYSEQFDQELQKEPAETGTEQPKIQGTTLSLPQKPVSTAEQDETVEKKLLEYCKAASDKRSKLLPDLEALLPKISPDLKTQVELAKNLVEKIDAYEKAEKFDVTQLEKEIEELDQILSVQFYLSYLKNEIQIKEESKKPEPNTQKMQKLLNGIKNQAIIDRVIKRYGLKVPTKSTRSSESSDLPATGTLVIGSEQRTLEPHLETLK